MLHRSGTTLNRNIALDILKLTMSFMVVGLHTRFLSETSPLGESVTTNGLFRIAVPIFLLISGFYFFSVVTKNAQLNWFKRIALLYTVWMLFYIYFWFFIPNSFSGVINLIFQIFIGYQHLWYISGMLGAAAILLLVRHLPSKILGASILGTFLTGVFLQYCLKYDWVQEFTRYPVLDNDWLHRNFIFFSYPFFGLGYLIHKHSLHRRIPLHIAIILSVTGLILLLGESSLNFFHQKRGGGFDNFLSLLWICPSIFILFTKATVVGKSKQIAQYSSAIYFVHLLFLNFLYKFTSIKGTMLTLAVLALSAGASFFIVRINNRLKFIL